MLRALSTSILIMVWTTSSEMAFAQDRAEGLVIEHSGNEGELIVSRAGIVYWLATGDDLYENDILRAQKADMATITFNGCLMTLPQKEDVILDNEFCALVVANEPTIAQVASEDGVLHEPIAIQSAASAPLVVGGVVLSAGGLVAATDGGNGGTESAASRAAGAPQAGVDP